MVKLFQTGFVRSYALMFLLEVAAPLDLLASYLEQERGCSADHGIRLNVVGRRDRLPRRVVRAIELAEAATATGALLHLRIAIDYSARDALNRAIHSDPTGEVDLLIRTGGEKRLSDFLLWECAYAELVFVDRPWPEFGARDLRTAIAGYRRRHRRFGRLTPGDDEAAVAPSSRPSHATPVRESNESPIESREAWFSGGTGDAVVQEIRVRLSVPS